ncbi:MAG: segregation/condensation protein A [Chloroflexi bacterium]|nr:segregation/condensation protein A [Chloroflexota bacterium]
MFSNSKSNEIDFQQNFCYVRATNQQDDSKVDYRVRLAVFEGPLDLLLTLIERRELDITAISLAMVTDQYLEYLETVEMVDPDALADFLVVAAKLLVIKSFALLPSPMPTAEEEEDAADLTHALLQFQAFQRAAEGLRAREDSVLRAYPRVAKQPEPTTALARPQISLAALVTAYKQHQARMAEAPLEVTIPEATWTVAEKILVIKDMLARGAMVTFTSLLDTATSRLEAVVTFLALLQLIKEGLVFVEQRKIFGEIYLSRGGRNHAGTETRRGAEG